MMPTLTLIRCVLCQGTLPGVQDEVFVAHMRDHHRTFHNIDFMFAASCLTEENIENTVDFMKMNNNNEPLDDKEHIVETNAKETKKEFLQSEDTFNKRDDDNAQGIKNETIKVTEIKVHETYQKEAITKATQHLPFTSKRSAPQRSSSTKAYALTMLRSGSSPSEVSKARGIPLRTLQDWRKAAIKAGTFGADGDGDLARPAPRKGAGPCICIFCGKVFPTKNNLDTHVRVVHDEEKHTCDLCGKEINGRFKLNKHKKIFHKALEPCPHCGKMVKRMTQHIKTEHLNNAEKKYQCQTCGKGFVRKGKLKEHERIHSDIRPFLCRVGKEECGHRSKLSGNRNKHEKLCKFNPEFNP